MVFKKHLKLFRKLLGNIGRPRHGMKGNYVRVAKSFYLLVSWLIEIGGDILTFNKSHNSVNISAAPRILIVKNDQLGDVIFSTFLLKPLKQKYPDAQIDYLVRPGAVQVLERNPYVAAVYRWNNVILDLLPGRGSRGGIGAKIRQNRITRRQLENNRYDVLINARAYPPSANFSWRGLGKFLISFDISEHSFLADYWAEYDLEREEWKNYANLLTPFGIDAASLEFSTLFHNFDAPNPMSEIGEYAVLSPVSFDADRDWNPRSWRELIELIVKGGMAVALTGMPAQRSYLEALAPTSNGEVRIFTSLRLSEFGSLMRGASYFIGIDSFPAHLALALNKRAAFLVNPGVYYLKGHSRVRFASEARSMLPDIQDVSFFNVRSARPEEVVSALCISELAK